LVHRGDVPLKIHIGVKYVKLLQPMKLFMILGEKWLSGEESKVGLSSLYPPYFGECTMHNAQCRVQNAECIKKRTIKDKMWQKYLQI